ncbi:YheT family hydrolase, partial [Undibacterium sp.]|uniref:YheT family hydrolase n=1 Tax=Undibacterium sp. TaxID=1914977 RepID=UPI002CE53A40
MNYQAPLWLPTGHLQTIYPALFIPKPAVGFRRERWDTPDGDFIDVDFVDGQPGQPFVVMFHGLEGSSDSHYARALMAALRARGWSGAVPHFRGCSGELNRAPRFYHSGDAQEIDWIIRRLQQGYRNNYPDGKFFASGVSLGGNALLRWIGESQHQAELVDAAISISAPLDLTQGGVSLSRGINMLYTRMFLRTLKPKC